MHVAMQIANFTLRNLLSHFVAVTTDYYVHSRGIELIAEH